MTGILKKGEVFPDFRLPDQSGKDFHLTDFLGRPVVLFFYPKDNTAVCTREVCAFRDEYDGFKNLNVTVAGISRDDIVSHKEFAEKFQLPFPLLSDPGGSLLKSLGYGKFLGIFSQRVTIVIDKDGRVADIFQSQWKWKYHVRKSLASLRELQKSTSPRLDNEHKVNRF